MKTKFIFLYGKSFDDCIALYRTIKGETKSIGSLEGLFISELNPFTEFKGGNRPVQRDEMKMFEEIYDGKFVPFED